MCEPKADAETLHTRAYNHLFDITVYLNGFYSSERINSTTAPYSRFFIEKTIRILHDDKERLGKHKALEFGGGPTLWFSFIIAQYVESIRFCDYAQTNLQAVKDWIEQKPNAFDWTNYFKSILDIAGCPKEKLGEWKTRLHDALTRGGLSTCDVNDLNCPILSGKNNEYDIIFSSLCLEAACLTIDIFNETIKRLVRLLKPGGLLLLATVRNETFYYVGKEKFFCLPLDERKVEEALRGTGELVDIQINNIDTPIKDRKPSKVSDYDGKMVVRAYKTVE